MASTGPRVLVVDAANVVGSRPDGWWRDRPGAARRLGEQLLVWVASGEAPEQVVLVQEGRARAGLPVGLADGVRVVHAAGEGDDEIVAQVAAAAGEVTVVTADRGLRGRVQQLGALTVGPTWLRDQLD